MKKWIIVVWVLMVMLEVNAQRFITKNGHIKFHSETPMETIEAHNNQVNCVLDTQSGDFVFKVLMKSFEFEKALMQEHFNENYVESDKFPNATFKGNVSNVSEMDFGKEGEYSAIVEGELTIHGVTQKVSEKGSFIVKGGNITGTSVFIIKPADYEIKIPKTVVANIAEEIEVTVNVEMEEFKK
ncbi:MAG: YceI family protein [Bacteroidales bacterium]